MRFNLTLNLCAISVLVTVPRAVTTGYKAKSISPRYRSGFCEAFTTETGPTEFHREISDSLVANVVFGLRFLKTKIIPTIKITVTMPATLITFITTTPYFPVTGS